MAVAAALVLGGCSDDGIVRRECDEAVLRIEPGRFVDVGDERRWVVRATMTDGDGDGVQHAELELVFDGAEMVDDFAATDADGVASLSLSEAGVAFNRRTVDGFTGAYQVAFDGTFTGTGDVDVDPGVVYCEATARGRIPPDQLPAPS